MKERLSKNQLICLIIIAGACEPHNIDGTGDVRVIPLYIDRLPDSMFDSVDHRYKFVKNLADRGFIHIERRHFLYITPKGKAAVDDDVERSKANCKQDDKGEIMNANLSRNHDGDILLVVDGEVKQVVAKAFSELWHALIEEEKRIRAEYVEAAPSKIPDIGLGYVNLLQREKVTGVYGDKESGCFAVTVEDAPSQEPVKAQQSLWTNCTTKDFTFNPHTKDNWLKQGHAVNHYYTTPPDAAAQIADLKAELSKFQESSFNPDWSMLEATRASLREHGELLRGRMEQIAKLEKRIKELEAPSQEPDACLIPCGSVAATAKVDGKYYQIIWGKHHLATRWLYEASPDADAQIAELTDERDWYKKRCDLLQENQHTMRDPERTIVCDILANGKLLEPAGDRYTASSQEPVAFTNKEQLGYLQDQRYTQMPMAMWAKPLYEGVNIHLYSTPPDAAAQIAECNEFWGKKSDADYEQIQKLGMALENCRLFAARNRKEDWALLILGFCADGGVVGSVTR